MDYSTLKAGRELDALVAEKVMGWERIDKLADAKVSAYIQECWHSDRIPTRDDIHEQRMTWIVGGECDHASWMTPEGLPVEEYSLPHYSIHISAAWEVVERMKHNGISLVIMPYSCIPEQGYRVGIVPGGGLSIEAETDYLVAESAPLAICRTALLAVSKEANAAPDDDFSEDLQGPLYLGA